MKLMNLNRIALTAFLSLMPLFQVPVAQAFDALRDPKQLWEAKTEDVKRVTTARVILADYELIRKDFPEIRNLSNHDIDQWLLRNTAFISKEQAAQHVVNDPIQTEESFRMAYRPREYRRAHVFVADTGGLIDAKGTGAVDPSGGSHDNGLATLGDMIREYTYEKLIHALFIKDGRFDTVGSYAVIDYGFNIKHPDGGHSRAGTVLRQAHTRYHDGPMGARTRGQSTMLPRDLQVNIETFLRHFGVTSSVKWNGRDLVNLQGAQNGAVIDFGSFLTEKEFKNTVTFFYDANGSTAGITAEANVIMKPGDSNFIQPDPKMAIPFNIWGYSQTGKADSKYDNPYIWGHELAESLANGKASRHDAEQHVRNLFDTPAVQNIFNSIHPSCQGLF